MDDFPAKCCWWRSSQEALDSIHLYDKEDFEESFLNIKDVIEIKEFSDKLATDQRLDKREVNRITRILRSIPTEPDSGDEEADEGHAPAYEDVDEGHAPTDEEAEEPTGAPAIAEETIEIQRERRDKSFKLHLRKNPPAVKPFAIHRRSRELIEKKKLVARQKWYQSGKTRRFSGLKH